MQRRYYQSGRGARRANVIRIPHLFPFRYADDFRRRVRQPRLAYGARINSSDSAIFFKARRFFLAGDENETLRERRVGAFDGGMEQVAFETGHLEITDDGVERMLGNEL